jgi:hypothetical protein
MSRFYENVPSLKTNLYISQTIPAPKDMKNILKNLFGLAKKDGLPDVLYKFVSNDKCHHWLEKKTLAFPSLRLLNDPYESLILKNLQVGAASTVILEDHPVIKIKIAGMVDYATNTNYSPNARAERTEEEARLNAMITRRHLRQGRLIDRMGILSLTKNARSMPMWAHYASNSKGLCFGLDWSRIVQDMSILDRTDLENRKFYVLPVKYENAPSLVQSIDDEMFLGLALGQKESDWAYEREVRLIWDLSFFRARSENFSIGVTPLKPEWVKEIILGVMPCDGVIKMLEKQRDFFSHATLSQIRFSGNEYKPSLVNLESIKMVNRPKVFPLARD